MSPGYFTTIGATLLQGRAFRSDEDSSKPQVVIVNQAMARQFFGNANPVGRHLSYLSEPPKPMEIVGLVEDIREGPLDTAVLPAMYLPLLQNADSDVGLVVRTSQPEGRLLPEMERAIREIDRGVITFGGTTMVGRIHNSYAAYMARSSAWLAGSFAALALLLSAVGLYGVIAYSVSQRTKEIGIRMALGAQQSTVHRMVLKEAGWITAIGLACGLACALLAGTLIAKLLFGVQPWDPTTLVTSALVLGGTAMLASYVPARRAGAANPMDALRSQ